MTDVGETSSPAAAQRWLDAEETDAWLQFSEIVIRMTSALDTQLQNDADLSFYEYMVLAMLSEQSERTLGMGSLARLTSGSLSRLSHVVKRLEREGYVVREASPHDRRHTNAVLTDAGMAKIIESAPGHVEHVRHLVFDALTREQVSALSEISATIKSRIDPTGRSNLSDASPRPWRDLADRT
ncbi:MarR family winged helix-turn-helix transcriptional regulator [Sanguibacter antarcticus]|uniref:DNA-binding MarR family transcriptional regulator n=1 Tax=Sanguibacter antarcticus TaxID=372484 RepID=A0A2A9E935_9MICO|nr:MarR family transcriptional regulator [Sanguibacter antarcticus]PFG34825.1 DNA-binding MarR family transcriptional regulator [Sanguibacter antarcticus]